MVEALLTATMREGIAPVGARRTNRILSQPFGEELTIGPGEATGLRIDAFSTKDEKLSSSNVHIMEPCARYSEY